MVGDERTPVRPVTKGSPGNYEMLIRELQEVKIVLEKIGDKNARWKALGSELPNILDKVEYFSQKQRFDLVVKMISGFLKRFYALAQELSPEEKKELPDMIRTKLIRLENREASSVEGLRTIITGILTEYMDEKEAEEYTAALKGESLRNELNIVFSALTRHINERQKEQVERAVVERLAQNGFEANDLEDAIKRLTEAASEKLEKEREANEKLLHSVEKDLARARQEIDRLNELALPYDKRALNPMLELVESEISDGRAKEASEAVADLRSVIRREGVRALQLEMKRVWSHVAKVISNAGKLGLDVGEFQQKLSAIPKKARLSNLLALRELEEEMAQFLHTQSDDKYRKVMDAIDDSKSLLESHGLSTVTLSLMARHLEKMKDAEDYENLLKNAPILMKKAVAVTRGEVKKYILSVFRKYDANKKKFMMRGVLEDMSRLRSEVISTFRAGKLEEALEAAHQLGDRMDEELSRAFVEVGAEARSKMAALVKVAEMEVRHYPEATRHLSETLDQASKLLESGEYQETLELLESAEQAFENAKKEADDREREAIRMSLKAVLQKLEIQGIDDAEYREVLEEDDIDKLKSAYARASERLRSSLSARLKDGIVTAGKQIIRLKSLGLDTSKLEASLNTIRQATGAGKIENPLKEVLELNRRLKALEAGYFRKIGKTAISSIEKTLEKLDDSSINKGRYTKAIEQYGPKVMKGDEAATLAIEAISHELTNRVSEIIRTIFETRMLPLSATLKDLESSGADVDALKKQYNALKDMLRSGRTAGFSKAYGELTSNLNKLSASHYRTLLSPFLSDLRSRMQEASANGIDVSDLQKGVLSAEDGLKGDIDKAKYEFTRSQIERYISTVNSRLELSRSIAATEQMTALRISTEELKQRGSDVSELQEISRRAHDELSRRHYKRAISILKEGLERAREIDNQMDLQESSALYDKCRRDLFDAVRIGLDAREKMRFSKLLAKSRKYIDARDGTAALLTLKKIDKELADVLTSLWRSRAKEALAKAEESVESASMLDVSELQASLETARSRFKAASYPEAYSTALTIPPAAEALVSAYWRTKAEDTLKSVKEQTLKLKGKVNIKELIGAYKDVMAAIKAGEYKKAYELAGSAEKLADRKEREYLRSQAEAVIKDASAGFDALKKIGAPTGDMEGRIKELESLFEKGDYSNIIEARRSLELELKQRQKEFNRMRAEKAMRAAKELADIKMLVSWLDETGISVDAINNELTAISENIRKRDYDKALKLMSASKKELTKLRNDYLKDAFNKVKLRLMSELETAEDMGLDASEYRQKMNSVEETATQFGYRQAGKELEKLIKTVQTVIKQELSSKAARAIGAAKAALNRATEASADVSRVNEALAKAMASFDAGDYKGAYRSAVKAEKEGNLAHEEKRTADIESAISSLKEGMKALPEEINTNNINAIISSITSLVKEKDYDSADAQLNKASELLSELTFSYRSKEIKKKISALMITQASLFKFGADISDLKGLVKLARKALEKKDLESATTFAERAEEEAAALRRYYQARHLIEKLGVVVGEYRSVSSEIGEKNLGILEGIEPMFKTARQLIDSGDFDSADKMIKDLSNRIKDAYRQYRSSLLKQALDAVLSEVQKEEAKGSNMDDARALYRTAMEYLSLNEYEKVDAAIEELKSNIESARKVRKMKVAKKAVGDAQDYILSLKGSGADLSRADVEIQKAIVSMQYSEFDAAVSMALRAKKLADKAYIRYKKDEAARIIDADGKRLEELKKMRANISRAKSIFSNYEKLYGENRFDAISSLHEQFVKVADELELNAKRRNLSDMIKSTEQYIHEIEEFGADVHASHQLIKMAHESMKLDKLDMIEKYTDRAKAAAQEAKRQLIRERTLDSLLNVEDAIEEAEILKLKSSDARQILKQGYEHLKQGNYDMAGESAAKAQDILQKRIEEHYIKTSEEVLEDADTRIKKLMDEGITGEAALKLLKEAGEKRESGDYQGAIELGEKAQASAEAEYIDFLKEQVTSSILIAKVKFAEAKRDGVNVDKAEKYINRAEELYNQQSYLKAYNLITKSMNWISQKISQHKNQLTIKAIETVKGRIKDAAVEGLDVDNYKKALEDISGKMEQSDYDNAIKAAENLKTEIDEAINRALMLKVGKFITEINSSLEVLRGFGIDTSEMEETFGKIRGSFEYHDYRNAIETATELLTRINEVRDAYLRQRVGEAIERSAKLIREAKAAGLDTEEFENILTLVNNEVDAGDLAKANEYVDSLERSIKGALDSYYMRKVNRAVDKIRNKMAKLQKLGLDLSMVDSRILEAMSLAQNGQFRLAIKVIKAAEKEMKEQEERFKEAKKKETIQYIQSQIDDAKKSGMDVTDLNNLINNAQSLLNNTKSSAEDYAKDTDKLISKIRNEYLSKRIQEITGRAMLRAERIEYLGGDIQRIKDLAQEINWALKFNDFAAAKKGAKNISTLSREELIRQINASIPAIIEKAKVTESEYEIKILDDITPELELAKKDIKSKEVDKAFEHIRNANEKYLTFELEAKRNRAQKRIARMKQAARFMLKKKINELFAQDILSNAETAFSEDRFDDVEILYGKMEQIYDEAKNTDSLRKLSALVERIAGDLERLKDAGLDVSGIEKLISEFKKAEKSRAVGEAESLYNEMEEKQRLLNNQYYAQEALSELENIGLSIKDLRRLGADVKAMEKEYSRATAAAEKQDYVEVLDILDKVRVNIDQVRDSFYKKRTAKEIFEAKKLIQSFKSRGIVSPRSEEMLKESIQLMKEKEYREAMSILKDIKEVLQAAQADYNKLTEKIQLVRANVDEAVRMGIYTEDISSMLAEAEVYKQKGLYDKSEEMARKCDTRINKVMNDVMQKRLNDKVKSVRFMISESEERDIPVLEPQMLLQQAELAARYKDYKTAMKMAKLAEARMKEEIDEHIRSRVRSSLSRISSDIETLISNGYARMDVIDKARHLMESASSELEKNPRRANEFMLQAKTLIGNMVEGMNKNLSTTYLSVIEEKIENIKELGISASEFEKAFSEIIEKRKEGKFADAVENAMGLIEHMDNQIHTVEQAQKKFKAISTFLSDLHNIGVSTVKPDHLLKTCETEMAEGNYQDVLGTLDVIEEETKNSVHEHMKSKALEALQSAEALLTNMKSTGESSAQVEELFNESKVAWENQQFKRVEKLASEAKELANLVKKNKELEAITGRKMELKKKLEEYEASGIVAPSAKTAMVKLELALKYKDSTEAAKLIEELEKELADAYTKHFSQEANHILLSAEAMMNKAMEFGLDVELQSELIEKTRALIKEDRFEEAQEQAKKVRRQVRAILDEYLERRAMNTIKAVSDIIKDLDQNGVDIGASNKLLIEAQKSFNEKNYDAAVELVDKALDLAKKTQYDYLFKRTEERITTTQNAINELKAEGADVSDVQGLLTMAQSYAGMGSFVEAESMIEESRDKLKKLEKEYWKQRAQDTISFVEFLVVSVKNFGGDTSEAERLIGQAKFKYDEGEYVEAEALAREAEEAAKEAKKVVQRKIGLELIENSEKQIIEIRDMGVDVSEAMDILRSAETALKYENFGRIEELAKLSVEKAREAKEKFRIQRATDVIKYASDLYNDLIKEGVDVSEGIQMLEKAKSAFNISKYEDAVEFGKNAIIQGQEIYTLFRKKRWLHLEFRRQNAMDMISKAQHELKMLKEEKVGDYKVISEGIQKAIFQFEEGQLEESINTSKSVLRSIRVTRREYISKKAFTILSELQEAITALKKNGLSVPDLEEAFARAESAANYRDYEKAISICNETIEAARDITRRQNIKEAIDTIFSAEEALMNARRYGMIFEEEEEKIGAAKQAFEADDISKAIKIARDIYVDISSKVKEAENAYRILEQLEKDITKLESAGMVVDDYKERLKAAMSAAREFEFSKASDIGYEIEKNLFTSRMDFLKESLGNRIGDIKASFDEYTALNPGIEESEEIRSQIEEIKELYEDSEYSDLDKKINALKEKIEEKKHMRMVDISVEILSTVESAVNKLEDRAVTDRIGRMIQLGRRALSNGEDSLALKHAKRAQAELENYMSEVEAKEPEEGPKPQTVDVGEIVELEGAYPEIGDEEPETGSKATESASPRRPASETATESAEEPDEGEPPANPENEVDDGDTGLKKPQPVKATPVKPRKKIKMKVKVKGAKESPVGMPIEAPDAQTSESSDGSPDNKPVVKDADDID